MKTALRVIITFFSFIASYFFIFWLPLSLIPGIHEVILLPNIISFVIAAALSILVWKRTSTTTEDFASTIVMGGIVVGAICFILGFFGPLIFVPDSNLGPLLGIFFTGPAGFILGLIGGAIYWKVKRNRKSPQ